MATTTVALLGTGAQAVGAASGVTSSIGDLVYRGQELALARQALKAQTEFNNNSLKLAALSPFIQAKASAYAYEQQLASKMSVAKSLGASQATLAAIAAGQNGVYVNGVLQPLHYNNSYATGTRNQPRQNLSLGSVSMPTNTVSKITNNFDRRGYGYQRAYSDASTVSTGSITSYTVNPSRRSSVGTASLVSNYYDFGFLAPGGTRL
nr:MAG: putative small basic protein [Caliciviridae sp.]